MWRSASFSFFRLNSQLYFVVYVRLVVLDCLGCFSLCSHFGRVWLEVGCSLFSFPDLQVRCSFECYEARGVGEEEPRPRWGR